nr:reverse transcriptase domain-containing protein [Tanacetum cinerariifolium]
MAAKGPGDLPVLDLWTMEELCQPSLNGRGGPIASIAIQATNFGLKNDMVQQVQNSCQFHGLPGDDANKHLDKFLHMAKMFLGKYFPPSMVTKLRNEITNFHQRPDESLFEALECYKLSIDRCSNHNMLPVTQIDTFYNGLTLRHRDTINAAAGGTFMKRPQRSESSSSITSSSDTKIAAPKAEMAKININLMRVLQVNQQVKAVTSNCETYEGPHSFSDCPAIVRNNKNIYAAGAYQGNSYQPQGNRNLLSYRSDNYLGPPGFNQNQNRNNQNHNFQNQDRNQRNHNPQGNNQRRNQFFQGANQGQNQPPAYQALVYQAPVHQPHIPQPQVVTTNKFTYFMKANDAILKNMQTNMTSLKFSNLELKNMSGQFMKMNTASSSGSGTLPGNTITNPKEDLKGITTRRGTAYPGPAIPTTSPSLVVERETEATKDTVHPTNNGSTEDVQPSVLVPPRPNQRPSIPYPSRLQDQKLHDKANDQREKFFQIFKDLNFNISFADALILMPKFGLSIKILLTNKDKLCELARTPLNEHCLAVLLKKLPEKLGDPDKFLIPCDFPGMAECLAMVDIGTSINLMPLFDADPRVPLILGRSFLKTKRALINVFKGELTLCIGKEAITFNLGQTSRYSDNYNDMMVNRIDVIDMACEEYSQEVLGFFDVIASGNPTPYYDSIVSATLSTLTLFKNSDFLLEEVDSFLAIEDDPTSSEVDQSYLDSEGDILLLEAFLNDDPSLPPPNQRNYLPEDLPPYLEYTFLEGDDKLPIIIAKDLSVEEKTALITVLKSHKRAIAWKLSVIKAGSESRPPMPNKENYVPWSSRLLRYAKSKPNGKLIHNSIPNGPYVKKMIPESTPMRSSATFHTGLLIQETMEEDEEDDEGAEAARGDAGHEGAGGSADMYHNMSQEKLGDPDKFLIPCDFPGMAECLAMADIGASINLMPLSVWNKLSLPDFSPTFDTDPRVPLILGRYFLKTRRALINVFEGELTLCIGKEAITFNLGQTSRYSANYNDVTVNRIDVIDMACEDYSQEVIAKYDKSSIDEPPKVELKDLPPHLEYTFLEGDDKFPIIIAKDLSVEEKTALITVLKSHKRAIAWKLSVIKAGSESRPTMPNKENYVPWSSRLLRYAKSRPNGKLIHNSILNGPYVKKMSPEPGDANRDITITETFHLQTDDELFDKELKQIEADDQAIQTILLGLPEDIYAAVDSCETAQEIWL